MRASYSIKAERLRAYRKYPPLSHFIHYKSEVYHIFKQKLDKKLYVFSKRYNDLGSQMRGML